MVPSAAGWVAGPCHDSQRVSGCRGRLDPTTIGVAAFSSEADAALRLVLRRSLRRSRFLQDTTTTVAELTALVEAFVAERDWQPFHDPKNLSTSIAIEAAELMEHFQWLRSEELDSVRDDPAKMAEIAEEVADIAAYLLSFAHTMRIDLSSALEAKMKKNALKYPAEKFRGRFK